MFNYSLIFFNLLKVVGNCLLLATLVARLLISSQPQIYFLQQILSYAFGKLRYGDVHCSFDKYNSHYTSRIYVSGSYKYSKDFIEMLFDFFLKDLLLLRIDQILATTKSTVAFNKFSTSVKRRSSAPVLRTFTLFKMFICRIIESFFGFQFIFQNN